MPGRALEGPGTPSGSPGPSRPGLDFSFSGLKPAGTAESLGLDTLRRPWTWSAVQSASGGPGSHTTIAAAGGQTCWRKCQPAGRRCLDRGARSCGMLVGAPGCAWRRAGACRAWACITWKATCWRRSPSPRNFLSGAAGYPAGGRAAIGPASASRWTMPRERPSTRPPSFWGSARADPGGRPGTLPVLPGPWSTALALISASAASRPRCAQPQNPLRSTIRRSLTSPAGSRRRWSTRLCIKCIRALKETGRRRIVIAGGVGANRRLRAAPP